ncbi:NUDIX hydrolase [Dehalococcoidia bacterium]|nr:NUDIX hydrolase [Dehalococcoidia bacterium]
MTNKLVGDVRRDVCSMCGQVAYVDPKLAATVLASLDGKLLLVRRAIEPHIGKWSFPAGYVDRGEAVESAAIREVKEETNLDVEIVRHIGLYSRDGSPVALAAYAANVVGGDLKPGTEAQDVRFFQRDQLPALPFPHDYEILDDWVQCPPFKGIQA